jgi:hypothetical protein
MRQGQGSKRSRGRSGGRRGGGGGRQQTFDSNGPNVRIRGNAHQIHEKYLTLARDASSSGDRVAAENYSQHAEHYFRLIAADAEQREQRNNGQNPQKGQRNNGRDNGSGDLDDDSEDEAVVEVPGAAAREAAGNNDDADDNQDSDQDGNKDGDRDGEDADANVADAVAAEQTKKRAPRQRTTSD